jgi:molybdate transport system ATP-binding protein
MADELSCVCRTRLGTAFELDASLRLPLDRAPITVLFGPSGAGKTTVLRMLAGLDRPLQGAIAFRGQTWFDAARGIFLAPQKRRAGYLAQDYALFPHLTVAANIAYAARPGKGREYLQAFGLADLAARHPRAISSGQRQRVALARALAAEPALLLLDEPLSALDAAARTRTGQQLRQMLLASGVPCIAVTHDRMEAVALGDWIAVIAAGRVRQCGPVQEVFRRPADAQVAESVGVENVLPARIVTREGGLLTLETGGAQLQSVDSGEAGPVVACIRAEDIALTRELSTASSMRNRLAGRVTSVTLEGPLARVELDCGFPLVAVITTQSAQDLALQPDDALCAIVKTTAVHMAAHSGGKDEPFQRNE